MGDQLGVHQSLSLSAHEIVILPGWGQPVPSCHRGGSHMWKDPSNVSPRAMASGANSEAFEVIIIGRISSQLHTPILYKSHVAHA